MDKLPKLVKPYLTIEETFNRLVKAGADLNKPEDIFLLASEESIRISLLIDQEITLINVKYATPHKIKNKKRFFFSDKDIQEYCNHYGGSDVSLKKIQKDLNNGDWMIPNKLFGSLDSEYECPINYINPAKPKAVSPYQILIDYTKGLDHIAGLEIFDCSNPKYFVQQQACSLLDNQLAAVSFEGELYYVCRKFEHDNYLTGNINFNLQIGKKNYKPDYVLDRKLLTDMIQENNHVVTRHSLMEFEKKVLGVDHKEVKLVPPYLDKESDCYSFELDIAIQAHNAIFQNGEGNQFKSHKDRVDSWLREKYPELSQSNKFLDRVSTVVTRKKKSNLKKR